MPRRFARVFGALVAGGCAFPAAPAAGVLAGGPAVVVEGNGFGHGVGMAQDGAYAMALGGAPALAILSHFYPGTSVARRTATVRVGVLESPGPVVVVLPAGGEVRDAPSGPQSAGFPVVVDPGGSVQLTFDGTTYRATPLSGAAITRVPLPAPAPSPPTTRTSPAATPPTTSLLDPLLGALTPTTVPPTTAPAGGVGTTLPPAPKAAASGRALWAVPRGDATVALPGTGRSYRGVVAAAGAGRALHLVNELDVEQYIRGLGEMPAAWPAAALQAQAIAARTYAIRASAAGRTLCDDQQCQVYIGVGNEHPATSAAASATRGQVLTYQGALAETVYSASGGGLSATAEEGFGPGSPDLAYLKPVAYAVPEPQLWSMTLPLRVAGARFGYRGEVTAIRVTRTGPSGRPVEVTFEGSNGPMAIDGHRFWATLQLRSTLFTVRDAGAAPVADGEPFATRQSDLPSFGGDHPLAAVAGMGPVTRSLGRAPWVGLAVLLLVTWATMADRVARRRNSAAGAT